MRGREAKRKLRQRGERVSGAGANASPDRSQDLRTPEQRGKLGLRRLEMKERKRKEREGFFPALQKKKKNSEKMLQAAFLK